MRKLLTPYSATKKSRIVENVLNTESSVLDTGNLLIKTCILLIKLNMSCAKLASNSSMSDLLWAVQLALIQDSIGGDTTSTIPLR